MEFTNFVYDTSFLGLVLFSTGLLTAIFYGCIEDCFAGRTDKYQ